MSFKRTDLDDEGSYSLFETAEPIGAGAGIYRHPGFQETFIIMERTFTFEVDAVPHDVGPGDVIVIPRGAWHGFRCTSSQPGCLLTIGSPARVFEAGVARSAPQTSIRARRTAAPPTTCARSLRATNSSSAKEDHRPAAFDVALPPTTAAEDLLELLMQPTSARRRC